MSSITTHVASAVQGARTRQLSGLQKEVIALYRALFRATSTPSKLSLRDHIRSEFRIHTGLKRTEVERIEYLVRKGRKQLEMMNMAGVKNVSFTQVK